MSQQRSDVFQFNFSSEISSFSAGHEEPIYQRTVIYIRTNFGQNQRALLLVDMIINGGMSGRRLVPACQEPRIRDVIALPTDGLVGGKTSVKRRPPEFGKQHLPRPNTLI